MSYCLNPHCQNPQNSEPVAICQNCGSNLWLKSRYRAIKPLGQSLLSRTFLAVDHDKPSQPRCVIQQFINPDGNTQSQKSFNEIRTREFYACAAKLDTLGKNTRIPDLLASFTQDEQRYWVYEYIEGRNLAQELAQEGVFQEMQIWRLLGELLPVLHLIHEHQLIHRDIKPENIIRCSTSTPGTRRQKGHLTLVDFGAATTTPGMAVNSTVMKGSAEYAAPEQTRGEAVASSDLYSLGVVCLHLLTQVSPFDLFDVKTNTWVWRHYLKQPVSRHLGRVLDQLVERNLVKRYRSAAEVLQDLKSGPTPGEMILDKPRWKLAAWGGAAIALLSFVLSSRLPSPQSPIAYQEPTPIIPIPALEMPPSNGDYFKSPLSAQTTPMRTLAYNAGPVWSVAVSQHGNIVASGCSDGTIQLWDLSTGQLLQSLQGHRGSVWSVAISGDGQTLVSGGDDHAIKIWDISSGTLKNTLLGHNDGIFSVVLSPDGKTLASGSKDHTVKLWDIASGQELRTLTGHTEPVQSVTFSPNGKLLASGSSDGKVKIWEPFNGKLITTLAEHDGPVWSVAFSPDGRTLASGSWDNTIKLWDTTPSKLGRVSRLPLRTLYGHLDKVQSLTFSADGKTLASGDFSGTIKLWSLRDGGLMGTLKGHTAWVNLAFDATGQELVSGSFDDTIKVWQVLP